MSTLVAPVPVSESSPETAEPAGRDAGYCGTTYAARLLGLSVATVQSLAEKGEIEAWKTQGGHRRISMDSISQYLARHSPPAARPASIQPQRLRVLIVEDDEITRDLYTWSFDDWGLPVDCTLVSSAIEALVDIASLCPDLLITDLCMSGVDGLEMLKVLSRNQQLADMQVLIVSGMEREAVADLGGVPEDAVFLKKPLNFDWLHGYISAMLSGRRRRV